MFLGWQVMDHRDRLSVVASLCKCGQVSLPAAVRHWIVVGFVMLSGPPGPLRCCHVAGPESDLNKRPSGSIAAGFCLGWFVFPLRFSLLIQRVSDVCCGTLNHTVVEETSPLCLCEGFLPKYGRSKTKL